MRACAGEEQSSQNEDVAARRKFLGDNPELLYQYASNLLPLLLQVYHGTVVQQVPLLAIFHNHFPKHSAYAFLAASCYKHLSCQV